MNKIKLPLLTVFIFGCVSVSAQMPHFSREKPHKPKPLIAKADNIVFRSDPKWVIRFDTLENKCQFFHPDSIYFTIQGQITAISKGQYIRNANLISTEEARTLRMLNDSLQKKLDKFVTFYSYVCPIMDALHLTDENKFQLKRAELAKRYRLYLEYYEPEYIANARKRQRK